MYNASTFEWVIDMKDCQHEKDNSSGIKRKKTPNLIAFHCSKQLLVPILDCNDLSHLKYI